MLGIPLCGVDEFAAKSRVALGDKKGAPDNVVRFTKKLYETADVIGEEAFTLYKEKVRGSAEKALKESRRTVQDWWGLLLSDFESEVGFKFRVDKDATDEVCEMMALGMQRYCSWRSQFHNQMATRLDRHVAFENACAEFQVNAQIVDAIEALRHPEQQFFSTSQFRGIGKFMDTYRHHFGKATVEDALKAYCAEANHVQNPLLTPKKLRTHPARVGWVASRGGRRWVGQRGNHRRP